MLRRKNICRHYARKTVVIARQDRSNQNSVFTHDDDDITSRYELAFISE